jgi:hypothetical protein
MTSPRVPASPRPKRLLAVVGGFVVAGLVAWLVPSYASSVRRVAKPSGPALSGTRPLATLPSQASTTSSPATSEVPTSPVPAAATTVDPGALPQTGAFPSSESPAFEAEMADLWQGVLSGSLAPALPAFFPESAYLQLKAVYNPAADYEDRLVHQFGLDLAAAHQLLGPDPASARLVAVSVPGQYAHWVPPGTCYNRVGYFEVPNSRVIFEEGGQERSFGIASMISWRGQWYVVHLASVLGSGPGLVDAPASGPGYSAYSATC